MEKAEMLPRPTKEQLEWADAELGVLIHYDIQVFEPGYEWREQWGYQPSPSVFQPSQLDTDQWIRTAVSAGARYAVLVAKHCSGFSLWPTEAHEYSVKNSPWKDGNGDIVGDFIRSCEKYGIRPGLYYSTSANAYFGVDNPGKVKSGDLSEQIRYNESVIQQLTELWSNYGKLFEIWFDGGTLPPEQGGPDVRSLLQKLQPQAVCFQGPKELPSLIRWIGNEDGVASYPCWSTTDIVSNFDGHAECPLYGNGNPDGTVWAPAEADMPNRKPNQWFWAEGEDHLLYSVNELTECYYRSVGCNANLLIGMVIDNRGLVPDADAKQFEAFGAEIRRRFGSVLSRTHGSGAQLILEFGSVTLLNHRVLMEQIEGGERIRKYKIDAMTSDGYVEIARGQSIGHKRIERFEAVEAASIRLTILESNGLPSLRDFAAYYVE